MAPKAFLAGVLAVCTLPSVWAADTSTTPSATTAGAGRTRRTATIHWERVPLHEALGRLTKLFDEPIFIDRRMDPSQRVSLNIESAALEEVLTALSATTSLGVSRLDPLHYLGPSSAAEQLRTVATVRREEAARLPANRRAALGLKQPVTWPRLTEPRELVIALARRRGWRIDQAERIPHDLWPAGGLPALALSDQLTVLLMGFDLTFAIKPAERTLEIVPLRPVTVNRRYRLPREFSHPDALLQQVPAARAQVQGATMSVDARVEEHEQLAELLRGQSARPAASRSRQQSKQIYTLRVQEQPVGAVLNELAARLEWAIEVDADSIRAAGLSLEKRVTFSVENSNQHELLEAVLGPAGLDYRREGERLRIVPRER